MSAIVNLVSVERDINLDLVTVPVGDFEEGSLQLAEADDVLLSDLRNWLETPLYHDVGNPFYGNLFDYYAGSTSAEEVLNLCRRDWKKYLIEEERLTNRVDSASAKVIIDVETEQLVFTVKSIISGAIIAVR